MYNNLVETLKAELNHNSEASQNLLQLITTIEVEDTKMNEFETSTSKGGDQGESSSLLKQRNKETKRTKIVFIKQVSRFMDWRT